MKFYRTFLPLRYAQFLLYSDEQCFMLKYLEEQMQCFVTAINKVHSSVPINTTSFGNFFSASYAATLFAGTSSSPTAMSAVEKKDHTILNKGTITRPNSRLVTGQGNS